MTHVIDELRKLHTRAENKLGQSYCVHCAELCHSYEGLSCDDPDGKWPCETMNIIETHKDVMAIRIVMQAWLDGQQYESDILGPITLDGLRMAMKYGSQWENEIVSGPFDVSTINSLNVLITKVEQ